MLPCFRFRHSLTRVGACLWPGHRWLGRCAVIKVLGLLPRTSLELVISRSLFLPTVRAPLAIFSPHVRRLLGYHEQEVTGYGDQPLTSSEGMFRAMDSQRNSGARASGVAAGELYMATRPVAQVKSFATGQASTFGNGLDLSARPAQSHTSVPYSNHGSVTQSLNWQAVDPSGSSLLASGIGEPFAGLGLPASGVPHGQVPLNGDQRNLGWFCTCFCTFLCSGRGRSKACCLCPRRSKACCLWETSLT